MESYEKGSEEFGEKKLPLHFLIFSFFNIITQQSIKVYLMQFNVILLNTFSLLNKKKQYSQKAVLGKNNPITSQGPIVVQLEYTSLSLRC